MSRDWGGRQQDSCFDVLDLYTNLPTTRQKVFSLALGWIRLGLDTALAQKLAGIAFSHFRELAKPFPSDPRSKRQARTARVPESGRL